jgi:ubiquitin carboxyl-terminal hydrolase 44/49
MLKVDFKNAFNMIDRSAFLMEVKEHIPELYAWIVFSYQAPALLLFGTVALESQTGVQQGDPLGPLHFAQVMHKIVRQIAVQVPGLLINLWYLDDGTLIGTFADVLAAFNIIERMGPSMGAHLQHTKSELWWPSRGSNIDCFPPGVVRVNNAGVELLGSPIGTAASMTDYVMRKLKKLDVIDEMVCKMDDAQIELAINRSCLGSGKLTHMLRTCPPEMIAPAIASFDLRLRNILTHIVRTPFITDNQWKHANLPVRSGGLGITSVSDIADPAYYGSTVLTHELVTRILGPNFPSNPAPTRITAVAARLAADTGTATPVLADMIGHKKVQKLYMSLKETKSLENLLKSVDTRTATIIRHDANKQAGAWITMPPIRALGQRIDNLAFRTQIRRWLGIPMETMERRCTKCPMTMDIHCDHAMVCAMGNERTLRHDAIKDILAQLGGDTGHVTTSEELGLLPNHPGLKPGDVAIRGIHFDCPVSAYDVTVTSVLQSNNNHKAAVDACYRSKEGHDTKIFKWADLCREANVRFMPLAFDSIGGATPQVHSVIKAWSELAANRKRVDAKSIRASVYRKISAAILKFNSRAVLERMVPGTCDWII